MLEKRILHLISFKRIGMLSKKWMPIATVLLCTLLIVPILVSNPISADDRGYSPKDNEELFGTWVNIEYNEEGWWVKIVFNKDETYETYDSEKSAKPPYLGKFVIDDKWTDTEGNVWYKFYTTYAMKGHIGGGGGYWLARIGGSGNTIEGVFASNEYPEQIDPNNLKYKYIVYYRQ